MSASAARHLPEAVLRPVRGHHAFEACVEQLATTIRLGVYPLGTTLPSERELADRLSVSRATLREAMAALREAGLVETTRGRGGGTVVTLKPRTPSGARRRPDLAAQAPGLAGRAGVPPDRRARAPPTSPRSRSSPTTAASSSSRRSPRSPAPGARPTTGRPTRASTSPSPRSPTRRA